MEHLCKELDRIRREKDLSMQDVVRATKFCKTTVAEAFGRPHRGRHSNPRLATLEKITQLLGVELVVVTSERASEG